VIYRFSDAWECSDRRLEPEELDTIKFIQMIQTESWPRRNDQWWVVDYSLLVPLFLESAQVFIRNHGGHEDCTLAGKLQWHGCCIGAVGFERQLSWFEVQDVEGVGVARIFSVPNN
jgi:hypothetical protein